MDEIINAIADERQKQIQNGLYLPQERYMFNDTSITELASCYLSSHNLCHLYSEDNHFQKNHLNRKDQLIIAGALIVAEIQKIEYWERELYCFAKYLP